jgi:DNA-directed RNA polymerase subunit RPC12/RpoP
MSFALLLATVHSRTISSKKTDGGEAMANNYVCMRCGQETDNPHFDLISGVVRCPICLEQETSLLGKLRGPEGKDAANDPD